MISTQMLKFHPIFSALSNQMLEKIAAFSEIETVDKDCLLFDEGDPATHLYIIQKGAISLVMNLPNSVEGKKLHSSSSITQGELLGWSSLVGPNYYKFGAYANHPTRLIKVNGGKLKLLMNEDPCQGYMILEKISEVIGERLEFKCIQVLSMVENNAVPA